MNGQKCNLLTDPPYGIKANKQTLGTGKKQFYRGENWDNEVPDFFYVLTLIDKAIIWGGNYFTFLCALNNLRFTALPIFITLYACVAVIRCLSLGLLTACKKFFNECASFLSNKCA